MRCSGSEKGYPSDIKREQFEVIRPLLESARKKTAPRRVDPPPCVRIVVAPIELWTRLLNMAEG